MSASTFSASPKSPCAGWLNVIVALVVAFALSGCGLLPEVKDETATWSAQRLYEEAHGALTAGNYTRAIKLYDTLESRFPYGRYAQQAILESFAAFNELVTKFPDSRYTGDSLDRMKYLTNALATYEVKVARYYYSRGAYIAAANRAQGSLVTYPRTPANEAALDVLMKSYDKLGLIQLRDDSQNILARTFPQSPYITGAADKPWWK